MRRALTTLVMLAAVAMAPACTTPKTPEGKEHLVVSVYVEAVTFVTDLRKQGKIGDSDWQTIKEAIAAARGARRSLKEARESGASDSTLARLLDAAIRAMNEVVTLKQEQEALNR